MLVPFSELNDTSKVWIYQANRTFSTDELVDITRKLDEFIVQWTAHGKGLKAGYDIPVSYTHLTLPTIYSV